MDKPNLNQAEQVSQGCEPTVDRGDPFGLLGHDCRWLKLERPFPTAHHPRSPPENTDTPYRTNGMPYQIISNLFEGVFIFPQISESEPPI